MSRALKAIVLLPILCLSACSQPSETADAKPANEPVAAKPDKPERPKIPEASDQERQAIIADLDARIVQSKEVINDAAKAMANLALIDPQNMNGLHKFTTIQAIEEATATGEFAKAIEEHQELERKVKAKTAEFVKQLAECTTIRPLVVLSPDREQGLVDRIIDRYREKRLPMYEREYVAEKVGNRADQPAGQLARDVSNKVVYGWYERYDGEWLVKDADEFTKQRIDEIVDSIAAQTPVR